MHKQAKFCLFFSLVKFNTKRALSNNKVGIICMIAADCNKYANKLSLFKYANAISVLHILIAKKV